MATAAEEMAEGSTTRAHCAGLCCACDQVSVPNRTLWNPLQNFLLATLKAACVWPSACWSYFKPTRRLDVQKTTLLYGFLKTRCLKPPGDRRPPARKPPGHLCPQLPEDSRVFLQSAFSATRTWLFALLQGEQGECVRMSPALPPSRCVPPGQGLQSAPHRLLLSLQTSDLSLTEAAAWEQNTAVLLLVGSFKHIQNCTVKNLPFSF